MSENIELPCDPLIVRSVEITPPGSVIRAFRVELTDEAMKALETPCKKLPAYQGKQNGNA